jgi:hypothetical protein
LSTSLWDVLLIMFLLDKMRNRGIARYLSTTQEPWNWHAYQSFGHAPNTSMCVIITSESMCAQRRSRSSPLVPRNRLQTP